MEKVSEKAKRGRPPVIHELLADVYRESKWDSRRVILNRHYHLKAFTVIEEAKAAGETALGWLSGSVRSEDDGRLRYRMLESIRQYAQERLEASGNASTVRARHADYYVSLAETAGPRLRSHEQLEWARRMVRETDNFRVVLDWAVEISQQSQFFKGTATAFQQDHEVWQRLPSAAGDAQQEGDSLVCGHIAGLTL